MKSGEGFRRSRNSRDEGMDTKENKGNSPMESHLTHLKDEKDSRSKVGRARVQFGSHDLQGRPLQDFVQKSFLHVQ